MTRVGTLAAARYLLATTSLRTINLKIADNVSIDDYMPHLTNEEKWIEYKNHIQSESKKTRQELYALVHPQVGDHQFHAGRKEQAREDAASKLLGYLWILNKQQKTINKIDLFIQNGHLQELLTAQAELKECYPEYVALKEKIDDNRQQYEKVSHQNQQPGTQKSQLDKLDRAHEDLQQQINRLCEDNKNLEELIASIAFLKAHPPAKPHHHDEDHELHEKIEHASEATEGVVEIASSVDEVIDGSLEYVEKLRDIDSIVPVGEQVGEHAETVSSLSPAMEFMQAIPLVNNFIRGLNFLREAYTAYQDPNIPQRRTKIAAGITGGLVSICAGIVGSLLLAGAGLMATSAAVLATPIVLAAATVGVYSVALYRDSYVLHQARMQVEKNKTELNIVEGEIVKEKEMMISNHVNKMALSDVKNIAEIKNIQDIINAKREKLHVAQQPPSNPPLIEALRHDITGLCHQRNQLILRTPDVKRSIVEKINHDPRLIRLDLLQTNLNSALNTLQQARTQARKKVIISSICFVGVSLLLGAVCATGIGALVVGGIASAVLIGATAARIYINYKEKQDKAAHSQATSQPSHAGNIAHDHSHTHSSELQIYKTLLHDKQHDIASALVKQNAIQQSKQHHISPEQHLPISQQQALQVSTKNKESEGEGKGESEKDSDRPHI